MNSLLKITLVILINFFINNLSIASDATKYALPDITNYPPSVNGGYTANWGITQGKDGKLYFANSYGVLIYDGKKWESLILDGNYSARSIDVDQKGNILIGSKGNFGFISNDGKGNPKFISLKKYLDIDSKNTDTIYETITLENNEIFFRSLHKLFFYKNKKIITIDKVNKKKFGVSRYLNNKLYVAITGLGISRVDNKELIIMPNSEIFDNKTVTGFHLSKNNNLVVFTRKSGVYKKINDEFVKIKNNWIDDISVIYRSYGLSQNRIGLATYEGFYIFNENLEPMIHLDSNSGLRVDNVRSVFEDIAGNIWLGLDDGITKINNNSLFNFLPLSGTNLKSKVYSLEFFDEHLYVGTSTDIKKLEIDKDRKLKHKFIGVVTEDIKTQVWDLYNLGRNLLIGSNIGFGKVDINLDYEQIIDKKITGTVYEIKESRIFNNYLYLRAKKGLFLVDKKNPFLYKILYSGRPYYVSELVNKNEVWFKVSKKGVNRINFQSNDLEELDNLEIKLYDETDGFKSTVKIFNIYDRLIFKTEDDIFQFDEVSETFSISNLFDSVPNIENKKILDVKKTNNDTYWINFTERIDGKRVQEFYELNSSFIFQKLAFSSISEHQGIEFFFLENLTLMTSNEGIVVIDSTSSNLNLNSNSNLNQTLISSINNNNKYIYNSGPSQDLLDNEFITKDLFNFDQNKFSFSIALTDFKNEVNNKFRYKLDGFEDEYSLFQKNEVVTYTNLNPGDYTFYAQGINPEGVTSIPTSYSFSIQYPWWQSKIFYLLEFVFFSTLLFTTLFLKNTGRAAFIGTSLTFILILIFFEYISFTLDPIIAKYTNGVPVFSILIKVVLGTILLPLERFFNKTLDNFSTNFFVFFRR